MKHLIVGFILLSVTISYTGDNPEKEVKLLSEKISLPSREILKHRISHNQLSTAIMPPCFDKLTSLSDNLTKHVQAVDDVLCYITLAINTYNMLYWRLVSGMTLEEKEEARRCTWDLKPHLTKVILCEHAELIIKLEAHKFL